MQNQNQNYLNLTKLTLVFGFASKTHQQRDMDDSLFPVSNYCKSAHHAVAHLLFLDNQAVLFSFFFLNVGARTP